MEYRLRPAYQMGVVACRPTMSMVGDLQLMKVWGAASCRSSAYNPFQRVGNAPGHRGMVTDKLQSDIGLSDVDAAHKEAGMLSPSWTQVLDGEGSCWSGGSDPWGGKDGLPDMVTSRLGVAVRHLNS